MAAHYTAATVSRTLRVSLNLEGREHSPSARGLRWTILASPSHTLCRVLI